MQFISGTFLVFLALMMAVYYAVKPKYRYLVVLVASYVFYGWNDLSVVPVLLATTVWTYFGGRVLEKSKKRWVYALFFVVNILVLGVYKYTDFLITNVNRVAAASGLSVMLEPANLVAPIGLSFYIFQSSSYLGDVYRKGYAAEKNFMRYAAFTSFFPAILSGPIQRSRDLLPQLDAPGGADFEQARRGFLLFLWGMLEKLLVANKLADVCTTIFNGYQTYTGAHLILAAACFSIYIYSDFSSYSDMACGVANMLGINIRGNFRNPYLAESLSDFWNRWHMSLNTWFVENIYIPMGGSRKGRLRKYLNIMVVFFISGIWHGASWNFVAWGILNGLLRVVGEILAPVRRKAYSRLKIEYECASMRFVRRGIVFALRSA